jgi:hypothetical protein
MQRGILFAGMGALLVTASALAAQSAGLFEFSPTPRWAKESENAELCAAIRAECPAMAAKGSIDASMAIDELHDVKGKLAGIRLTRSSGCKPLDEAMMVRRKEFHQGFEERGTPTLSDVTAELKPGTDPASVRLVRRVDNFQIGMGC